MISIPKILKFLFRSNIRILYKSTAVVDNYTKADICRVTDHNVTDICAYEGTRYLKKYKKFLSKGDIGYYAYMNGKCVHRVWLTARLGAINKGLPFPPFRLMSREVYCHFCETAPAARGNNIAAAVLSKAAVDLKDKVDHFYTLVDENNHASRRVMEKCGFKEVKRLKRTSFIWLNFYRALLLATSWDVAQVLYENWLSL